MTAEFIKHRIFINQLDVRTRVWETLTKYPILVNGYQVHWITVCKFSNSWWVHKADKILLWFCQSRGIHVIYVFLLCYRNYHFKMNDHDLFLWSFKCHKLFATWPITDTYMCVWYKKKSWKLYIFLLSSLTFQVEEELERILKFEREVTGQEEQMLSNWRRQGVKLKAFPTQRFSHW